MHIHIDIYIYTCVWGWKYDTRDVFLLSCEGGLKIPRILEVQEWASSIFAAPGHARNLARRQADAAAATWVTTCWGHGKTMEKPAKSLLNVIQRHLNNLKMNGKPWFCQPETWVFSCVPHVFALKKPVIAVWASFPWVVGGSCATSPTHLELHVLHNYFITLSACFINRIGIYIYIIYIFKPICTSQNSSLRSLPKGDVFCTKIWTAERSGIDSNECRRNKCLAKCRPRNCIAPCQPWLHG